MCRNNHSRPELKLKRCDHASCWAVDDDLCASWMVRIRSMCIDCYGPHRGNKDSSSGCSCANHYDYEACHDNDTSGVNEESRLMTVMFISGLDCIALVRVEYSETLMRMICGHHSVPKIPLIRIDHYPPSM